jgi:secondary thiamine-phosphate synthase enzyme
MNIKTEYLHFSTKGKNQIINITSDVNMAIKKSGISDGIINIFVIGSTAGITTIEYEPGLVKDLSEVFERIAPANDNYHHNNRWQDGNGYAHVRSSLLGPSISIPIIESIMALGNWQQVVLIDFDNRPRDRKILCKIIGE